MITLFPDQLDTIQKTRQALTHYKRVLMQSPTGSGKSIMAAYMIASSRAKDKKSLFIVPRRELLRQMSSTFAEFHIPHSFVASGLPFNPYAKTHIASLSTLTKRLDKINPDVIFVDETHFGGAGLDSVMQHFKDKYIIGLSATPCKLSGQGLDCWYDDMVLGPSIRWLIENKRLSDYKGYAPSHVNLSGVKITAGDYAKGQLSDKMEQDKVLIGNAVKHYIDHANGRLNVAFCVSIKHSQMVAEEFRNAGIPAAHIDGTTPDEERKRIIKAFARRELRVLCNVDLLTFGFDLASNAGMDVTVEAMSDLRPTKSTALQLQKWGRVLRYKEYPALIFDHANNFKEHGLPDDEREWSLEGKAKGSGDEKATPVRQCTKCFFCHRPAPICPACGFVYPVEYREIEQVEGELKEIDREAQRKQARIEQGRATTLEELIEIGKARKYKFPAQWAARVLAGRMMGK